MCSSGSRSNSGKAPRRRGVNPVDSLELAQCLIGEDQKFTPLDVRQGLVCKTGFKGFGQVASAIFVFNQSTVVDIGLIYPFLRVAALGELLEDCRARREVANHLPFRRFR